MSSVVIAQWVNGIQAQKEREPFFKNSKRSITINPYIYVGVGVEMILQLFAIYVVPDWFSTVPIPVEQWRYPIILSMLAFAVVEARKWIQFSFSQKSDRQIRNPRHHA